MAAGYNDGYAVGFATACKGEPLVIDGEWRNASYGEGYASGVTDGTLDCVARP
jgi:hypothetical protein